MCLVHCWLVAAKAAIREALSNSWGGLHPLLRKFDHEPVCLVSECNVHWLDLQ